MLVTFCNGENRSITAKICHQHKRSPSSVTNFDVTYKNWELTIANWPHFQDMHPKYCLRILPSNDNVKLLLLKLLIACNWSYYLTPTSGLLPVYWTNTAVRVKKWTRYFFFLVPHPTNMKYLQWDSKAKFIHVMNFYFGIQLANSHETEGV